jgi:hypothetical protein
MTETAATFLAVAAVYGLDCTARRPSPLGAALAGATLALAALCRPGLLVFALFAAIGLTWMADSWSQRLRQGAALAAGMLIVLCPWAARNQSVFSRPLLATTHGGYTLLLGNNPFFYDYLRKGQWGLAWNAAQFHTWWQRELEAEKTGQVRFWKDRQPMARDCSSEADANTLDAQKRTCPVFLGPSAELRADGLAYRWALRSVGDMPGMFGYSCVVRVGRLWSPLPHRLSADESPLRCAARYAVGAWYTVVLALAAVGVWSILAGAGSANVSAANRSVWVWGLLMAVSLTVVHIVYWSNLRMRAPLVPVISLLAVQGCINLIGRARLRYGSRSG